MVKCLVALLLLLSLSACDWQERQDRAVAKDFARAEAVEKRRREGPCSDEATLLATTAGSPNAHRCPNHAHRIRFEVQHAVSGEEIGVLVVCECVRTAEAVK